MREDRVDLAFGIVLGLVLGVLVVALFVFVFSEDTVDAPSIDNGAQTTTSTAPP